MPLKLIGASYYFHHNATLNKKFTARLCIFLSIVQPGTLGKVFTFFPIIQRFAKAGSVFAEIVEIRPLAESFERIRSRRDVVKDGGVNDTEHSKGETDQHHKNHQKRNGLQHRDAFL